MAEIESVEVSFDGDAAAGGPYSVASGSLSEGLSRPYELRLRLTTEADGPHPAELLGKSAAATLVRAGATERRVAGIVASVDTPRRPADAGRAGAVTAVVEITLRPALEALRHRVNTRIYQDLSVPEILEEVLGEGLGAYGRTVELRLDRSYPTAEYRVQYDESDLAFCHRLMEEEGIAYFFETEGDEELLVLADADGAYGEVEAVGGSPIPILLRADERLPREHLERLEARAAIRPTKLSMRHFDWTRPSSPIEGESSDEAPADVPSGAHLDPAREIYEHGSRPLTLSGYDGSVYGDNDLDAQIESRREAQAMGARVVDGASSVLAMRPGAFFEASGHRAAVTDGRHRVLEVEHSFGRGTYENRFTCLPEAAPYRPRRATPRPAIRSAQTATVVGPAGEEIHTDSHGRIKVQFHWDRLGATDEKSSCWIRVLQPWAGAGYGFLFLPRIGMEVVVRFVDGDPDRPLVLGSLYNGDNPPPYALPDDKTKSTIKTSSSLGGGGFNELRFEDLAGSEQVYVHAQKDFNEVVENDHTSTVHHDQTIRVDNDQSQEIGNDQAEHVVANQDLTVDADRAVTVHGDFTETIDGSETRIVSSGCTETIDAGETRTVTGGVTETITGDRTQTIDGGSTESITGSLAQTIVGGATVTTPATYEISAAGGFKINAVAGITILAPAGHTIISPGGQTWVDDNHTKSGVNEFRSAGVHLTLTTFFLRYKTLWLVASGALTDMTLIRWQNTGVNLNTIGGGICRKGTCSINYGGIRNWIAGVHKK